MKKLFSLILAGLVGCGNSNDKDTQAISLSGQIATQPQRLIVGQEAEFKFFGTNLPPTNLWGVTVSDCEQLKIKNNINASDSLVFSCIPKSLGKKDIFLSSGSYSFNYLQQIEVFCPDQHISVANICVSPNNVNNLWQVKNPSKSSGLFVKASLNPSAMVGQGVMYSIEWGDGISDAYRFSSNSYEETTHQYESAGTYAVSLRLYGDDNKSTFIDKKTISINKMGKIEVFNYQPSIFEVVKLWIVGVFDDVKKIVWSNGSQGSELTTAYSETGIKTVTASLFNTDEEKIGELSTQLNVGCPLGKTQKNNACIDNPLEEVDVSPNVITELTKTKITVTAKALPSSAVLEIDGAVCDAPIERISNSFSQWCVASNVGQVMATVKYAKNINYGKVQVPLMINIKPIIFQSLNDTGIGKCSDANTFFDDCSGLALNWLNLNQDAQIGRDSLAATGQLTKVGAGIAGFDFSKIDAAGQKLPDNASQWSCVLDNNTSLLWENKTNDNGLHDANNLYSYYNSDATSNSGVLGYLNDGRNSEAFVLAVNQEKLCGYSDWRLPSAGELLGIADFGSTQETAIDNTYFLNTKGAWYLTGTISYKKYSPFVINFNSQNISNFAANREYFVRLVRGGK